VAVSKSSIGGPQRRKTLQWNEPSRGKSFVRQVNFDESLRRWHIVQAEEDDDLDDLFRDDPSQPDLLEKTEDDDQFAPEQLPDGDQPDGDEDADADQRRVDKAKEYAQDCEKSIAELRRAKLANISLDINPEGTAGKDYPRQCELEVNELRLPSFRSGYADPTHVAWTASGLCYKPLYFEDRALERYGHSTGPYTQPLLSAAHFFGTLPILPYKMGLRAPNECVYTLGHYRPGNCAPYIVPAIPFTWRAGLYQAGATVGAAYLLP